MTALLRLRGVIAFHERANQMIWYLTRLPLVGKHIPESLYRAGALKTVLAVLGMVFGAGWTLLRKAFYCAVMLVMPAGLTAVSRWQDLPLLFSNAVDIDMWIAAAAQQWRGPVLCGLMLWYFIVLNLLFGCFFNTVTFSVEDEDFVMLSQMRVGSRPYLTGKILTKAVTEAAGFLIPLAVLLGWPMALLLTVIRFSGHWIGEAADIRLFENTGRCLGDRKKLGLAALPAAALTAYGLPLLTGPGFPERLAGPAALPVLCVTAVLSAAACFAAVRWLGRYPGFPKIAHAYYSYDRLMELNTAMEEAFTAKAEVNDLKTDEALTTAQRRRVEKKSGFAYLHELFQIRHRQLIRDAAVKKTAVTAAVSAAAAAAMLLIPASAREWLWHFLTHRFGGVLIFVMYMLSGTARVCKAYFFHCDESMLRYGYYRKPRVLLGMFTRRIRSLLPWEILPALPMAAVFLAAPVLLGHAAEWYRGAAVAAEAVLLAVFFTTYHLFAYYVFQPYTHEATVRNPFFSVFNALVYLAAWIGLNAEIDSVWLPVIVLGVIAVFVPAALVLVHALSPKTFRVR